MSLRAIISLLTVLLLQAATGHAQTRVEVPCPDTTRLGYHIEGDEVVFEFDRRDYAVVSQEHRNGLLDFEDIDVEKVVLSGEFNGWSRKGWVMHRVDENRFQLRKKLSDFQGKLEWQYKYVINGHLWGEPPAQAANAVDSDVPGRKNLTLSVAEPSLRGNTTFRLCRYPHARRVFLAGEFNDWRPEEILCARMDGEWICRIDLPPGRYEYKFVVDGVWITDPANPSLAANGPYLNSVRVVE